jgi:MFS family permease
VDAIGGREVLAVSNVIFAAGLALLAFAYTQAALWVAWLILGVGMGVGLYDTAFAALGRIYGLQARSARRRTDRVKRRCAYIESEQSRSIRSRRLSNQLAAHALVQC